MPKLHAQSPTQSYAARRKPTQSYAARRKPTQSGAAPGIQGHRGTTNKNKRE